MSRGMTTMSNGSMPMVEYASNSSLAFMLPIGVVVALHAPDIVQLAFGSAYAMSARSLMTLVLAIPLSYLGVGVDQSGQPVVFPVVNSLSWVTSLTLQPSDSCTPRPSRRVS